MDPLLLGPLCEKKSSSSASTYWLSMGEGSGIRLQLLMVFYCSSGFAGSQPVSMDVQNIRLLSQKPYRVSWKADGTRYFIVVKFSAL